jgi:transglutaminase-like putative cysteine protease
MIIEVQHETRFSYTTPVKEAVTEVRMEPLSDAEQSCHSFHLAVNPPTEVFCYQDGFGKRVHHFNLLAPHDAAGILAASIVETHRPPRDLASCRATYPVNLDTADLELIGYLGLSGPVRPTPLLQPLLAALQPLPGQALGEIVSRVAGHIQTHFEYARDVTLASSPIDHLLEKGKGVCQDFTHLMIALLRSFEVPARYVSGYIHRPNKESQSHAWCEVWLPDLGWFGIDPTNNRVVDDHFVKVAVGRDFSDVPPNRGVYQACHGRAEQSIFVRVATRELERLPSLSWQEQLPPLDIPLTVILPRHRVERRDDDDDQQQQQ